MALPKLASVLVLALALVAAACGSGASGTGESSTGSDAGSGSSSTSGGGNAGTGSSSTSGGGSTSSSSSSTSTSGASSSSASSSTSSGSASSGSSSSGTGSSSSGTSADGGSTGDVVGKVAVGYQGWFTAPNDGSGLNPPWWHYTNDRNTPSPSDPTYIKSWPIMTDFTKTYATGYANLGSGGAATLFSAYDASTVDAQVNWMQQNGIDTVALQRFNDFPSVRNQVATNVRMAAEAHDRKFYIMYDISGWTTFNTDIPNDWTNTIVAQLKLTSSPAYAKQGGKPVICVWGLGYNGHPGTPADTLAFIQTMEQMGLYVIGGLPNDWRTADGTRWGQAGFLDAYNALNAISPWMVGVIGSDADSDNNRTQYNEGDVTYCQSHGIDYQPCVLPGDLSANQRVHGDFMWHQFGNMIQIGSDALYISMYDEFNEGNQIAKTAATAADEPTDVTLPTLDEDGTACSSDYYLRLTGDGGKMLKGQIPFTFTRPTSPE
jgi:hypothetical protein